MVEKLKNEVGSSLVYVLIISLILSATLLILFTFILIQTRHINAKDNFLKAKYAAESGLYTYINQMQNSGIRNVSGENFNNLIKVTDRDSAKIICYPWGGYRYVSSQSHHRGQSFQLTAYLGMEQSAIFHYAIIMNPEYSSLVVTGDTRIHGDVQTGLKGVKKGTIAGRPYTGDQLVYGRIIKNREDQRPHLNKAYIDDVYRYFHDRLQNASPVNFENLVSDKSDSVSLGGMENCFLLNNEILNNRNWKIKGPGVLISDEALTINTALTINEQVQILCNHKIKIEGPAQIQDAIFFSPENINVSTAYRFEGQLFSERSILIGQAVHLDYPSIAMVYTSRDTGSITIANGVEINGTVLYLSNRDTIVSSPSSGKIDIQPGATVNGIVCSDNYTTLSGQVNGAIITDRFYYYYSPTVYFNWIKDGIIDRNKLNDEYKLPLFFKISNPQLTPLFLR